MTEEGSIVKLTAVMSYNEEKTSHEFYVKVFPPILSTDEKVMKALEQSLFGGR